MKPTRARRIAGLATSLPAALLLSLSAAASAREGLQSQRDFEIAIARLSTAPSYVLITAVDARTGAERTGCIVAPFLVGAILQERRMPVSPTAIAEAQRIAAAALDHRFVFHRAAALRNLGLDRLDTRNEQACRLIRAGQAASMGDPGGGEVFAGYPAGPLPVLPPGARPDRILLAPIARAAAAAAFRIHPSYRPAARAHVQIVGAYRLELPGRAHPVEGFALGYLPVTVRAGNGRCVTISADYVGDGLSNGAATPSDCAPLDRAVRGEAPAAPRPGLRYVNSSWGFSAWADDRTGQTIVTTAEGGATQPILTVDMAIVGIYAMNSPDSPHSDISFLGSLGGQDALVTIGLTY
jgi:hypothetical protein